MTTEKTNLPAPRDKLDEIGLDFICQAIMDGATMTNIALGAGVSFGCLSGWIAATDERSARVREARILAARYWDEEAERRIDLAQDKDELAKARELAHHYRWRASKIAPRDYGDKVALTGPDGGAIQTVTTYALPANGRDETPEAPDVDG